MTDDRMVQFLLEQLDDTAVTSRSMFGGHGIYRDGRMFALVYDNQVYMKVTEDEAKTSVRSPFSRPGGRTFRSYREVSADELEHREKLAELAAKAQQAAGS